MLSVNNVFSKIKSINQLYCFAKRIDFWNKLPNQIKKSNYVKNSRLDVLKKNGEKKNLRDHFVNFWIEFHFYLILY